MGRRDILFVGLIAVGAAAVWGELLRIDRPGEDDRVATADVDEVRPTVERVDRAWASQLAADKKAPPYGADDLTVLRRLSLALVGAGPSLQEIRQFEALSEGDRVARWTNQLLADRRSSDYLAERFARAWVGVEDGPFIIYRRRRFVSWLADALQENRPYDEIVREVIAAEGLWTDRPATNFVTVTIADNDKGPDEARLARRVSRAFLGVRLDCAQCHDHPFADWKRTDFHGLAAFFGSTTQTITGVRDKPAKEKPNGESAADYEAENPKTCKMEPFAPRVPMLAELDPGDGSPRRRLAAWVTHRDNRAFARATVNRVWALLIGKPLVEPLDDVPSAGGPATLDVLADDFSSHGYDLRRLIRAITGSRAFAASSASPQNCEADAATARFPLTRLRPEQVVGSLVQSASLTTIGYDSHIVTRLLRGAAQNDFISRYGDAGEDELADGGGTIPQRLILMNGKLLDDKVSDSLLFSAAGQVAKLAPSDDAAIETVYLAVLTRRPSPEERQHFAARFHDAPNRISAVQDLYWALLNSTEFAWNH